LGLLRALLGDRVSLMIYTLHDLAHKEYSGSTIQAGMLIALNDAVKFVGLAHAFVSKGAKPTV
jgi:hypothetical protein